jgi:hypothetical protein
LGLKDLNLWRVESFFGSSVPIRKKLIFFASLAPGLSYWRIGIRKERREIEELRDLGIKEGKGWMTGGRWVLNFYPFFDETINFFSVNYTKDENAGAGNLKNNAVISHSQLPVSLKSPL